MIDETWSREEHLPECRDCGGTDITREREITDRQYITLDVEGDTIFASVDSDDQDGYSEWVWKCSCGREAPFLEYILALAPDPDDEGWDD